MRMNKINAILKKYLYKKYKTICFINNWGYWSWPVTFYLIIKLFYLFIIIYNILIILQFYISL